VKWFYGAKWSPGFTAGSFLLIDKRILTFRLLVSDWSSVLRTR
jgi:hypothetical protein